MLCKLGIAKKINDFDKNKKIMRGCFFKESPQFFSIFWKDQMSCNHLLCCTYKIM